MLMLRSTVSHPASRASRSFDDRKLLTNLSAQQRVRRKGISSLRASETTVVVVESPSKAVKIQKYLGQGYQVLTSLGHVRDIEAKQGAVDVDNAFAIRWEITESGAKQLKLISEALKNASRLVLATDPDREGEAISWHVAQTLKEQDGPFTKPVQRISFNEISESAVLDAIKNPRTIDVDLVNAYQARRVIDHLMGFSVSPVLWRKLPGARSAGRVQSPCLRLICDRENEIIHFRSRQYWTIEAQLITEDGHAFGAELTHIDGRSLSKMSLSTEEKAQNAVTKIESSSFAVKSVAEIERKERPLAPYRTSTLQQDAATKLGWTSQRTMQVAQSLYEGKKSSDAQGGLITYMRTDGVGIAAKSIGSIRQLIRDKYGDESVPTNARQYTKKALNAQEAHEAIRPTDIYLTADKLPRTLSAAEQKLYYLIWSRTVASQMSDAHYLHKTALISDEQCQIQLRSTARRTVSVGFRAVYQADDGNTGKDMSAQLYSVLETLKEGEDIKEIDPQSIVHKTNPPPRYSDASIVKNIEKLGIGRPSTYSTILPLLISRGYVQRTKKSYTAKPLGRVLSVYLQDQFKDFTDFQFTSKMETRLDAIAAGKEDWKAVAEEFWKVLDATINEAMKTRATEIIDYINAQILDSIFLPFVTKEKPLNKLLKCPSCQNGKLLIKLSRYGPFISCDQHKNNGCKHLQSITSLRQESKETAATKAKPDSEQSEEPKENAVV